VHCCRCSEVQSELRSGKARPPIKDLFQNNSRARDDQGGNVAKVVGATLSEVFVVDLMSVADHMHMKLSIAVANQPLVFTNFTFFDCSFHMS